MQNNGLSYSKTLKPHSTFTQATSSFWNSEIPYSHFIKLIGEDFGEDNKRILQAFPLKNASYFDLKFHQSEINNWRLDIKNLGTQHAYTWFISCNFPYSLKDQFGAIYHPNKADQDYKVVFQYPVYEVAHIEYNGTRKFNLTVNSEINEHHFCKINEGSKFYLKY